METNQKQNTAVRLFTAVIVCNAIAGGLSSSIFSNYLKEVYHVTALQRGFIEFPRELPGVLCMVVVSMLGFLPDTTIAVIAFAMYAFGLFVRGCMSPGYQVMLVTLFISSLGQHVFMPLNDSIGMSLAQEGNVGKTLGYFKSRAMKWSMITCCVVLVGFRTGFFSFQTPVILSTMLAAGFAALAAVLLWRLGKCIVPQKKEGKKKGKFVFRKKYLPYYIVTFAYGCQKRVKLVYGPWVIIELLHQGADVTALLTIVCHFLAMFLTPAIGKCLDRLGVKKTLYAEAGYLIGAYTLLGVSAGMLASGKTAPTGIWMALTFVFYILSYLGDSFGMVHAFLMRSLAEDKSEITASLSTGLAVDHVMAVVVSFLFGLVWQMWGPQYVFYLSAATALLQALAGSMVRVPVTEKS